MPCLEFEYPKVPHGTSPPTKKPAQPVTRRTKPNSFLKGEPFRKQESQNSVRGIFQALTVKLGYSLGLCDHVLRQTTDASVPLKSPRGKR